MNPGADQQLTLAVPEQLLRTLAERIAEHLDHARSAATDSPWLDARAAAAYLGFSRDRVYKLTAAGAIPFRKKRDGQGLLFHRDELDRWLEAHYPRQGWQG